MTHTCKDYGDNPACLRWADDRYTMDYTDVEGGAFIYWCANCGPVAHMMEQAINEAVVTRPGFVAEFAAALEAVPPEDRRTKVEGPPIVDRLLGPELFDD